VSRPPLTIKRLSPSLRDDFLQFMEGAAFADHPKWRSCYCQFLYVDHNQVNWHQRTAGENQADACRRSGLVSFLSCRSLTGLPVRP